MIWWPFNLFPDNVEQFEGRNSPMIWWPFNQHGLNMKHNSEVVTHQWSGDPSIQEDAYQWAMYES